MGWALLSVLGLLNVQWIVGVTDDVKRAAQRLYLFARGQPKSIFDDTDYASGVDHASQATSDSKLVSSILDMDDNPNQDPHDAIMQLSEAVVDGRDLIKNLYHPDIMNSTCIGCMLYPRQEPVRQETDGVFFSVVPGEVAAARDHLEILRLALTCGNQKTRYCKICKRENPIQEMLSLDGARAGDVICIHLRRQDLANTVQPLVLNPLRKFAELLVSTVDVATMSRQSPTTIDNRRLELVGMVFYGEGGHRHHNAAVKHNGRWSKLDDLKPVAQSITFAELQDEVAHLMFYRVRGTIFEGPAGETSK